MIFTRPDNHSGFGPGTSGNENIGRNDEFQTITISFKFFLDFRNGSSRNSPAFSYNLLIYKCSLCNQDLKKSKCWTFVTWEKPWQSHSIWVLWCAISIFGNQIFFISHPINPKSTIWIYSVKKYLEFYKKKYHH